MQDKAQEISAVIWRWYKEVISKDKGDHEWDVMIEAGKKLVDQYKDDPLNYPLACDMMIIFSEHAGRLEKVQRGEEP